MTVQAQSICIYVFNGQHMVALGVHPASSTDSLRQRLSNKFGMTDCRIYRHSNACRKRIVELQDAATLSEAGIASGNILASTEDSTLLRELDTGSDDISMDVSELDATPYAGRPRNHVFA